LGRILNTVNLDQAVIRHVFKTPASEADYIGAEIDMLNDSSIIDIEKKRLRRWDMDKLVESMNIDSFKNHIIGEDGKTHGVVVGEHTQQHEQMPLLTRKLNLFMFKQLYRKFKKSSLKSFTRVLKGEGQYTEPLFYRVDKYKKVNSKPQKLNSYWITSPKDKNNLQLVDTQIQPDREYEYKIYAYYFVLKDEYTYKQIKDSAKSSTDYTADTDLETQHSEVELARKSTPKGLIIEELYGEIGNISISEKPPMPPEINIVPFVGVKDEIMVNLSANYGEITMSAIPILEEDVANFKNKLKSQGKIGSLTNPKNTILFRGDDSAKTYELFKLTEKPASYKAFAEAQKITVDAEYPSYRDKVVPNKFYYYTARTIDEHGNISNPTPIYEVKIVSNSGIIYSHIRVIDIKPDNSGLAMTKECKKYLAIVPAFDQFELPDTFDEKTVVGKKPAIGKELFDPNKKKRFKVRLISKSTGRRLDINVRFKHEHK